MLSIGKAPSRLILGCLLCSVLWSCKKETAPAGAPRTSQTPTASSAPQEPAPVVQIDGLNVGTLSPADMAWNELEKALEAPPTPPDWANREPNPAEVSEFEKRLGQAAADGAKKAKEFYEKYPDHAKATEAKEHELDLLNVAAQLGQTNLLERLESLEAARLSNPSVSAEDRLEIRIKQIQRLVQMSDESTNTVAKMEANVRSLAKEFADRPEPLSLLLSTAEGWMTAGDVNRANAIVKEVLSQKIPEEIEEGAKQIEKKLDRIGKPVDLKFTALDGRNVDIQSLKGRVVLIQFWATWSAASMKELSSLKDTYEAYHGDGFEIIGISLDRERAALDQAVADEKIPWPQSFEGENSLLAEQFAISTIPTQWLIGREGNLRDLNARANLKARVRRLLDEKKP